MIAFARALPALRRRVARDLADEGDGAGDGGLAERAESARGPGSPTSRRRLVKAAIDEVATFLGNTPAVARGSYVDPRVIDRFDEGLTIAAALAAEHETIEEDEPVPEQNVSERVRRAVLDLIADKEDARDVDKLAA